MFGLTTLRRQLTGLISCGAPVLRRRTLVKRIVFAATLLTFSTLMFQAGSGGVGNVVGKITAPAVSPQRRSDVIPRQIFTTLATPDALPDVPLAAPIPPAEALPVVSRQLPSSIEAIIAARFNESPYGADYWIAVAHCESSLRPSAIGHGETYIGLFQVWLNHGYGYAWLLDPYNNTLAAWELSREGTVTSPWPYCRYQ